jgi:hypothetical protein
VLGVEFQSQSKKNSEGGHNNIKFKVLKLRVVCDITISELLMPQPTTQSEQTVQCPYCWKSVSAYHGGLAKHITKSSQCPHQQQQQMSTLMNEQRTQSTLQVAMTAHQTDARNIPVVSAVPTMEEHDENDDFGFGGDISIDDHEFRAETPPVDPDSEHAGDAPATPEVDIPGSNFIPRDLGGAAPFVERNPQAGWTLSSPGKTMYDHMFDAEERGDPYYPWRDVVEWEMVQFLSRCGLSRAMIDEFLRLRYVSHRFLSKLSNLTLNCTGHRAPIFLWIC